MNLRQAIWAAVVGAAVATIPAVATSDTTSSKAAAEGKAANRSSSTSGAAKSSGSAGADKSGASGAEKNKAKDSNRSAGSGESSSKPKPAAKSPGAQVGGGQAGGTKTKGQAGSATASGRTPGGEPGAAPTPAPPQRPSGGGPSSAGGQVGDVDGATYVVRLRDLESRVDELKEQIRRSHTRLSLLSESVLESGVGGAEAQVVLRNAMSNAFRITNVLVVLDGTVQYNEGGPDAPHVRSKVTPIFSGAIPPGDHTIQVVVKLQGHGYGVFSYLKGYKFDAKGIHSFTVRQGKGVRIEATVWEKGTVTTPLEERPDVQFSEQPLEDAPELTTEAP